MQLWKRQPKGTKIALVTGGILALGILCCGGIGALAGDQPRTPTTSLTSWPPKYPPSWTPSSGPAVSVELSPSSASATTEAPPPVTAPTTLEPPPEPQSTPEPPQEVYYPNCAAAKAAGAAPLYRGEPGYRSGLDRDGDGVACER